MEQLPSLDIKYFPKANTFCDVCGTGAIVWARGGNVCYEHYIGLFQKDADRYCKENNLVTVEDKIAHCRKLLGLFIAKQPKPREPGSDDE